MPRSTIQISMLAFTVLCAFLCAGTAQAKFKVTVTTAKDFKIEDLKKVAVVTTQCHEVLECADLERRAISEISNLRVGFRAVPETLLRDFLFQHGATEYTPELRQAIADHFKIDAFLELKIPFAEKGDGFGGRESSQVKLELRLTDLEGAILLFGVGTGRPNNVVSSPERVAGNVVEKIVKKAFK